MKLTKAGELIKKELIASGIPEDEIKVMFKTEEEMIHYYKAAAAAKTFDPEEDPSEEPEPEDSFRLKPEEERATMEAKKQLDETEQRAKFEEQQAKGPKPKDNVEAIPPVEFDDFLKSITDGMTADDSNVPNN